MARRQTTTFSMSFLDVISCGFGAVVLFYTIISAQAGLYRIKENTDLNAQARLLEQEVLDGYKHLAELRTALESTEDRKIRAAGLSREMQDKLKATEEELARFEHDTLARREALERLKADLKSLEESTRRLKKTATPVDSGSSTPVLDRQQLVTLRVEGRRVLVLVDASASMLDETLVNVIRLRNMPPERRIASSKWQQAVNTVEWVAARLPQARRRRLGRGLGGAVGPAQHRADRRLQPAERLHRPALARPGPGQRDPRDRWAADPGRQAAAHAHAGDHGAARGPDAGRGEVAAAVAAAGQRRAAADGGRPVGADLLLAPRARDRRCVPEPGEGLAMKRRTRRDTETFSMSFLDCICCGFGAIIL